jgi:FAD/FMN-containing dehydrogenase
VGTPQNGAVDDPAVAELRSGFKGALLQPQDEGYEQTRRIWNGAIDKRPALIARCTGAADVQAAVRFGREQDLLVSVRGGGHQVAGHAVADEGLMIDLSLMRAVSVDPETKRARAAGGCLLGDLDRATQLYALATTAGVVSVTGIGGLTLGGGIGHLQGKHGFTVDNVRSIDLVTAEGELLTVNEETEPELFWGLRGGGGNFGVATAFEYQLHPVGPIVLAGAVAWPLDQAREVLRMLHDYMADPPDEVAALGVLRLAPPAPFLPPEQFGKPVVMVVLAYMGDPAAGAKALEPVRNVGTPIVDAVRPVPYLFLQSTFDAGAPAGFHYYLKANLLRELPDEVINGFVGHAASITSPFSQIRLHWISGEARRIDPESTATTGRNTTVDVNFTSAWSPLQPEADRHVKWARDGWEALQPHAESPMPQFVLDEDAAAVYGAKRLERLTALKDRWDPTNYFRLNQNVPPSGDSPTA